jgi:hypothetical protein
MNDCVWGESNYTRSMRLSLGIALALVAMMAAPAYAERAVTFGVTYEKVADNCPADGYAFDKGAVRIAAKGEKRAIVVSVSSVPELKGARGKAGKFKAAARGDSKVAGVDGKFSMAGRANRDGLQALFIIELFKDGKPMCTQSWSVTGKLEV